MALQSFLVASLALAPFTQARTGTTYSQKDCVGIQHHCDYVREEITNPDVFCQYYVAAPRSRSPIIGLDAAALTKACKCVLSEDNPPARAPVKPRPIPQPPYTCKTKYGSSIRKEFKHPQAFCKFFDAYPRNGSPIPGLCAADILEGCECILHPTTTTHKPSAYKSTSASTMKTTKKPRQSRIPRPYPTRGPEPETTMTNGPTMTDETSSQPASITMMDSSTSTISFVCPALPTQMVSVSGECCNYENTAIANFTNVYSGPHTHVNAGKVYNSTTFAVDLPGSSLAYECAQFVIQNQDPLEFGGFDLYYNASTPERWDCVVYEMRYSHPYDAVSDDLLCSYGFEETYFVEEGG